MTCLAIISVIIVRHGWIHVLSHKNWKVKAQEVLTSLEFKTDADRMRVGEVQVFLYSKTLIQGEIISVKINFNHFVQILKVPWYC